MSLLYRHLTRESLHGTLPRSPGYLYLPRPWRFLVISSSGKPLQLRQRLLTQYRDLGSFRETHKHSKRQAKVKCPSFLQHAENPIWIRLPSSYNLEETDAAFDIAHESFQDENAASVTDCTFWRVQGAPQFPSPAQDLHVPSQYAVYFLSDSRSSPPDSQDVKRPGIYDRGIRDVVSGGVARYSVEERWSEVATVPSTSPPPLGSTNSFPSHRATSRRSS
ncbi:hypothetical protein C8T65DRAFT_701695 [Cerioporus squamosus]|nr:hypothetical protein C8T65DRAFT_701695 [Cerioporus squamosus]